MTDLDDEIVPEVVAIIDEFGAAAALTVESEVVYDTNNMEVSKTSTSHSIKMVPPYPAKKDKVPSGVDYRKALYTLVYPSDDYTFESNSLITYRSEQYRVVSSSDIASGDSIAAVELWLERVSE